MNKIKIIILSFASLASLSLLGMQEASFSKFPELLPEIRQLIIIGALDKDNILQSLRNLKLVNKEFYNFFLNQDICVRQNIIKKLAEDLDTSARAIALNIINVFNLTHTNPQLAQQLLHNNPANQELTSKLFATIRNFDAKNVQSLIKQGADVNAQYYLGWTTLMRATFSGNINIVKLLLNAGAHVNAQGDDSETALMFAAYKGYTDIVELLLKHGANTDVQSVQFRKTALTYSIEKGYKDATKLLLKHGANVNVQDNDGRTALMLIAAYGNKDTVELLLNSGADITIKDNQGNLAYDYAFYNGHLDIAKILKPKNKHQVHCVIQ